jgi:DNA modification methylase/superfamily II DNA or RNA helicase
VAVENPVRGVQGMTNYQEFLKSKQHKINNCGIKIDRNLIHPKLFSWQKDIVQWATNKGRCAVFLDTGLGKTFIQLEWARLMNQNTLIIAPLSVARQTVKEALKIDIEVRYVRSQSEITSDHKLWITNYEMIEQFDYSQFGAVVLDESSILKSIGGRTRQKLTELCMPVKYKLCCTATPAPNDWPEIGNHTEYLGICKMNEMLATFFINANKEHTIEIEGKVYRKKGSNKNGTEWRLKHHAEKHFFQWLSSWAITMTKPSDLGYEDEGFILPKLNITPVYINSEYKPEDQLFFTKLHGITDRNKVRKTTVEGKLSKLKEIVSSRNEQWIIWCGLDAESEYAHEIIEGSTEVKGSDKLEDKVKALEDFQDGKIQYLVTKPKIAGFGMNFQNAHNMVFFGLNDSWETYYQSIRRQWRYGQKNEVNVYLILHEVEAEIYRNVMRKDAMAKRLKELLIEQIKDYEKGELGLDTQIQTEYQEDKVTGNGWIAMLGDSCERLKEIETSSIDLSVYSPPFADLFTYTASERDLGNSRDWNEFFGHYKYIISEIFRVTKPGRLTCVHTSDIPAMAQRDGYIGLRDFPGEVIRAYEREGWIFVGRAFVQKNPQAQAIRVKSKALLFVQLRKDSSDSRPALIDQVLIFKKPGDNLVPIKPVENGEMDNETWIEWANGIWLGISESDTLQFTRARGQDDEKHICPLQLGTIERCIKLYSNPGETVLTPFGGIGSEGYMAVKLGRKAVLIELKPEYYNVAIGNLKYAESMTNVKDLFSSNGVEV